MFKTRFCRQRNSPWSQTNITSTNCLFHIDTSPPAMKNIPHHRNSLSSHSKEYTWKSSLSATSCAGDKMQPPPWWGQTSELRHPASSFPKFNEAVAEFATSVVICSHRCRHADRSFYVFTHVCDVLEHGLPYFEINYSVCSQCFLPCITNNIKCVLLRTRCRTGSGG